MKALKIVLAILACLFVVLHLIVILRVKTSHRFAGQNHPPRGGFSSYQFLQCLQEV